MTASNDRNKRRSCPRLTQLWSCNRNGHRNGLCKITLVVEKDGPGSILGVTSFRGAGAPAGTSFWERKTQQVKKSGGWAKCSRSPELRVGLVNNKDPMCFKRKRADLCSESGGRVKTAHVPQTAAVSTRVRSQLCSVATRGDGGDGAGLPAGYRAIVQLRRLDLLTQAADCFSRLLFFSWLCDMYVVYMWPDAGGAGRCRLASSSPMTVVVINS